MGFDPLIKPKLPVGLTNATWQKKKSFIDKTKMNNKTGLGPELKKVETAWAKFDWKLLSASAHGKWHSVDELREARRKAERYYEVNMTDLHNVVAKTAAKARETAKLKGLSGSAKTYANFIGAELEGLGKELVKFNVDDFDADEERMKPLWAMARQALSKNVSDLETKLTQLERAPSNDNWTAFGIEDAFRSVGNALGTNSGFEDFWPDPWEKLDGLQNDKHPMLKKLKKDSPVTDAERDAILELIQGGRSAIAKLKPKLK